MKVWIAESTPYPAVLNGSANLTEAGLHHNREVVTRVPEDETRLVVRQIEELMGGASDATARIRNYIGGVYDDQGPSEDLSAGPVKPPAEGGRRARGCGCGTLTIVLITLFAVAYLFIQVVSSW